MTPFHREKPGTNEEKRLNQEAPLGLTPSLFGITNPALCLSFLAFFTFKSPCLPLVPSFLIGGVGYAPVSVSAPFQLLTFLCALSIWRYALPLVKAWKNDATNPTDSSNFSVPFIKC